MTKDIDLTENKGPSFELLKVELLSKNDLEFNVHFAIRKDRDHEFVSFEKRLMLEVEYSSNENHHGDIYVHRQYVEAILPEYGEFVDDKKEKNKLAEEFFDELVKQAGDQDEALKTQWVDDCMNEIVKKINDEYHDAIFDKCLDEIAGTGVTVL